MLNVKGLNDIQSVSNFANSASSLGLLGESGQDSKKLQTFLNTASGAGALAAGKVDMEAVSNTVNILQGSGILPASLHQPTQVLTLLNSAKNLGINNTNIAQKVSAALDIAKKAGIKLGTPKKPSSNQQEKQGPPPDAGKAITWEKLYFAPYHFKDILELDITQGINEHACLHIRGTLTDPPDGQSQDYVQMTEQNTPVTLHYTDSTGAIRCLFQGVVISVRQQTIAGLKYLDIEACSFSYLLDIKKHSRSFQREQEPYSYVFERVNDLARQYIPDLTGDVLAAQDKEASQTTEKLIIQYQETDWTFLKRMASHFNIGLTPDVTFDSAKIYFGLPPKPQEDNQGESQQDGEAEGGKQAEQKGPELNVSAYKIRRQTADYSVATNNNRKNSALTFSENDFTYCEAQSLDILQLGQQVTFLNLTWYIRAIHTIMVKGAINSIYTLTTQQGLMQDDLLNTKLAGISLRGIVKEVVKDEVRVHIHAIDQEWDDGGTWFFPYTTIYSSPDGSGWYCMPEIGDNVRIYFPNNKEAESVAASSVNFASYKRGRRDDPDSKIISTVYGKQIIITPGGIQIIANGNLLMTLSDDGGLTINSDKKIILNADDDIIIASQSRVEVRGKAEVSLSQGGGSINITDNINIGGNQVKIQP